MMDDTTKPGSPDTKRISLKQPHEVKYWTKRLGVSADRLRRAIYVTGTHSAITVEKWLKNHPTNEKGKKK